jgi:type IV pilus assembly protein PilC
MADDFASAVGKLKKMGLAIIELEEYTAVIQGRSFFGKEKKVPMEELSMFSNQLAAMVGAGMPVTMALHTLGQQSSHADFKDALLSIAYNVEGGMSLADAFAMYPSVFSTLYIAMIHSGEVGGMLEEVLRRLADQLQKEKQLRDSVKAATFYPRMVAGFAVVMFIGILVLLVPTFKTLIPPNVAVPLVTRMVFSLSDSVRNLWYAWLISIAVLIAAAFIFARSPLGKRVWDRVRFKIPAFGPITHKSVLARFARTLATLLEGGIPVVQALESAAPTSGSMIITKTIKATIQKIEEGKTIADPLKESKLFPPMMVQMISIGEDTGTLSKLLEKVAGFYEEEVNMLSKKLSTVIEPVILVLVGIVVGLMLIALYLPMFSSIVQSGLR